MDKVTAAAIRIKGIVQGVGFRPFIHRLAVRHHISGWVVNSSAGVQVQAEGTKERIYSFYTDITHYAPPRSHIIEKTIAYVSPEHYRSFCIKDNRAGEERFPLVSPDIAVCHECAVELFDSTNRRFQYPFITCSECGPRFTIISDMPYDRKGTTMSGFFMCAACESEYSDREDRRYHSQTNSCPVCGPQLTLVDKERKTIEGDPLLRAVEMLRKGSIVAIKGIGGFHLACDAESSEAVASLRIRKNRKDKPFAIMVKDIETALRYADISDVERTLLESPQSPILLLKKKKNSAIAQEVAPNQNFLGVMIAYTPLHFLLLSMIPALVMTSGNRSDDPLVYDNDEAQEKLQHIADYFLLHNRDILHRCDDSVVLVNGNEPQVIRRARGYAPVPLRTSFSLKQVLACGGELKNTFCFAQGNSLYVSQHMGDLTTAATNEFYGEALSSLKNITRIEPEIVAYDLHPQMLSTDFAFRYMDAHAVKGVGVQHHHAHIASCMVDNDIDGPVVGIVFDGTGYGEDGTLWGGEFMVVDYRHYERVGRLPSLPMPGGDAAVREPVRMGISLLYTVYGKKTSTLNLDIIRETPSDRLQIFLQMMEKRINTPLTSSCGRLFDAVAAILRIRDSITYEAQAAIELEMVADEEIIGKYGYDITEKDGLFVVDVSGIVYGIVSDLESGHDRSIISAKFHQSMVDCSIAMCQKIRKKTGVSRVALSGGVFQNRYLFTRLQSGLQQAGFPCFIHNRVPCNDGGISVGQAVIASYSE